MQTAQHVQQLFDALYARPLPAHIGILPSLPAAQTGLLCLPNLFHHCVSGAKTYFTQQLQWHTPPMYPSITSSTFRGPYPPSLQSDFNSRFTPRILKSSQDVALSPALFAISPKHQELKIVKPCSNEAPSLHGSNSSANHHHQLLHSLQHLEQRGFLSSNCKDTDSNSKGICSQSRINHNNYLVASTDTNESLNLQVVKGQTYDRTNHVKKPLNAFMLYMKEMRSKVVAECTLKESAAINQILGRRWHGLSREEQAKYYDMARKERQLHMQLYPGWTARDNYAASLKKKKKKRDKSSDGGGALKKCRARFGLDQQSNWCKPCRRKKKCIRYLDGGDTAGESEDNVGSVGSMEAPTPDSKSANDSDHDNLNLSSAELSLSSPPVPSSDYILPHHNNHHPNNQHPIIQLQNELNRVPSSVSSASSKPCTPHPPRNSPFSIEQLARPHCPSALRPSSNLSANKPKSPLSSCTTSIDSNSSLAVSQLPTPPSSDSSANAAPMLSVA